MEFSQKDLSQINNYGLQESEVQQQIENFVKGFKPMKLQSAATIGNGINRFSEKEIEDFISLYNSKVGETEIMKFVPASGAATRMMKDLYNFIEEYINEEETPISNFPKAEQVIKEIEHFAFYSQLKEIMQNNGKDLNICLKDKDYKTIIEYILLEKGLNYGKSPKAWILFHNYDGRFITPFEEHLIEAAKYCSKDNVANIEFSILKEHTEGFNKLMKEVLPLYEKTFGIKYNISFSYQEHSTDTIAVDLNNEPIHDKNGNLVFRPAGHGALLNNINNLNSDIIFIKNIDNVCSLYREESIKYKQLLAGVLLKVKQVVNSLQEKLSKNDLTAEGLNTICNNIKEQVLVNEVKSLECFSSEKEYQKYLISFLNRPIRVCGMVKNEGEPGGGPFYVEKDGNISLQIVEKAQVDLNNEKQKDLFLKATHFNPVDIVISTSNATGEKYNLNEFVDYEAGFISEKSFEGKTIKAQERPGLWNGSMSNWLTIFVEVPLKTFNPVKTINDLLKETHRV